MKSWMIDISKEILLEKQEAHVTTYKLHNLQNRLNEAIKNDTSHSRNLAYETPGEDGIS